MRGNGNFTVPGEPSGPPAGAGPHGGLRCADVSVQFPGDPPVTAVNAVTAEFSAGETHAMVGENGAGKTTLARALGGLIRPTAGDVFVGGARLHSGSVVDARQHGVELVHQHFAQPPDFTVAQTFELFSTGRRPFGAFRARSLRQTARELLADAGIHVDPDARIGSLPVETRQAIEITRALASSPRVLVLDEPTAVLPPQGVEQLFDRLRVLAARGICVIVVLHKLTEVAAVADTVSVLRRGQLVLPPTPAGQFGREDLAEMIMGQASVSAGACEVPPPGPSAPVALRLSGVTCRSGEQDAPLREVSLTVSAGEIVGIAGVEGNGQRSLAEAVTGLVALDAGDIHLADRPVRALSVRERRAAGLRVIPFDRNSEGVSLTSPVWHNYAVGVAGRRVISPRRLRARCREALARWGVTYRAETQPVGDLSGGNVQRVILARELDGDVQLLVAAHPTRGLDVGGGRFVRAALAGAAAGGAGIVLISADLDELYGLAHRIIVLCGGRVAGEFAAPFGERTARAVGRAMTGGEAA